MRKRKRGLITAATGTLFDAYLSRLLMLWKRVFPELFLSQGFEWTDENKLLDIYGRKRKVSSYKQCQRDDGSVVEYKRPVKVEEIPGVSPGFLVNFMIENTLFLHMLDCVQDMVPYQEILVEIEPTEPMADAYHRLDSELEDLAKQLRELDGTNLSGARLQAGLTYFERMHEGFEILHPDTEELLAWAPSLEEVYAETEDPLPTMTPKEAELVRICQQELAEGRLPYIFVESSSTTDITPRLTEVLQRHGITSMALKGDTTKNRQKKIDAIIDAGAIPMSNPKKVATGMDLLSTPTLIFYQIPMSSIVLRQASRRAWRIVQDKECRVYFLVYTVGWQAQLMHLIRKKILVALAVEGYMSAEGLAAMQDNSSASLAKELAKMLSKGQREQSSLKDAWTEMHREEIAMSQDEEVHANVIEAEYSFVSLGDEDVQSVKAKTVEAPKKPKQKVTKVKHTQEVIGAVLFDVISYEEKTSSGRRKKRVTQMTRSDAEKAKTSELIGMQGRLF